MTKIKEIDIVYALTSPSSDFEKQRAVRALVEYLRSRKNYLDDALADLISIDGTSGLQLKLMKRSRQQKLSKAKLKRESITLKKFERDFAAFKFIRDLTGEVATTALINDVRLQISNERFTIRAERTAFVVRKNGVIEFRIPADEPVSERCAAYIASLLPGAMAYETIRTMVAKTRKAISLE